MTQQRGAGQGTANLVDKVIAQKQRIQPDATLCIEYKKRKAPPKGFEPLFPIGEIGVLGHLGKITPLGNNPRFVDFRTQISENPVIPEE